MVLAFNTGVQNAQVGQIQGPREKKIAGNFFGENNTNMRTQ